MVQDQVVDAVLVSALGFGLFDQDAGPAGRAWSEGLPASVDDGDAVLGILFRFLHLVLWLPQLRGGQSGTVEVTLPMSGDG